eukprot:1159566-Pelagomonas_calceolata.AAC.15
MQLAWARTCSTSSLMQLACVPGHDDAAGMSTHLQHALDDAAGMGAQGDVCSAAQDEGEGKVF